MAIAALVSSLVLAPLGIVFGHISLSQIKRTGEDGRGLAIAGLVIGYVGTGLYLLVAIGAMAALFAASSAVRSIDGYVYTTPTISETVLGTADSTAAAIRNASVGDCIHRVTGATRRDGTIDVTVSPASCGSSYATDRVTQRTDDTSDCSGRWVQTKAYSPPIVLCLTAE